MFGNYAPLKNSLPVAMVALGSYGREQLCVHSDIDLMIVYRDIPGYNTKVFIEKILYILWDTGMKLGHRVHTVDELYSVSKTDITIKSAMLESRFIEGSNFIWTGTQNALRQIRHDDIEGYIKAKLLEQKEKHEKYPLSMEPNLKEGVGGFRDANLIFWIGKILYNVDSIKNLPGEIISEKEYRAFRIALEFLFRVRSALHLTANKKEDTLRLDLIPHVARLLGYADTPSELMKFSRKVTESLKIIRLYSTIWIELLSRSYLRIDPTIAYIYPKVDNEKLLPLFEQLCDEAETPFTPHPTMLQALVNAQKPERLNKTFYKTIAKLFYKPHIYNVLTTISSARLLKYIIPPIKRVVDLPQFDGYHRYAVDIHSMEAIKHLEAIHDPFISDLFDALLADEKALLKIVTFLHDAGKGRKRDHHNVGASLFKVFATKLGMKSDLIEMGETLILHHTLMSRIAQREDLYNDKVILKFASQFKTKKMLDLIYILTYADMNAVGEGIYNSFSANLIATLYNRALETLTQTEFLNETAKRVKKEQALSRNETFMTLTKSEQKKILLIPSNLLFLNHSADEIVELAKTGFKVEDYYYALSNTDHLCIKIIQKTPVNLGYLLAKLSNLEIKQMDIYKLFDEIKYFHITFADKVNPDDLNATEQIIHEAFGQQQAIPLKKPLIKKEDLQFDCDHSQYFGVLYLNALNQKGLLAYIIDTFQQLDIDIATAKIHTIKNRAKDMFLIQKDGNFCHNIDKIINHLTEN